MKPTIFFFVLVVFSFTTSAQNTETHVVKSKKDRRIERRFIHPQSKYISASFGMGATATNIKDPNDFLNQGAIRRTHTYVPHVYYEHGIKNNFFIETGYSYTRQGIAYRRIIEGYGGFHHYLGFYHTHDIGVGGGYRVIILNNINVINLHGGFFAGVPGKYRTPYPINYLYTKFDPVNEIYFKVNIRSEFFDPVNFGAYLGFSKDFRLSKDVRLFAKYIYRFGFKPTIKGEYHLISDEFDFKPEPATFIVRGGGGFFSAGVKVQLFGEKLKNHVQD